MKNTENFSQKVIQIVALVGEEGCDLLAGLLVMLMVEHAYGTSGLGIFAFLLAAMFAVRYLTTFGVTRYVEIETAGATEEANDADLIAKGMQAILLCSFLGSFLLLVSAGFDSSHTRVDDQLVSYLLLALLVPISNYNSYKFAILNGQGRHGQAARFRIIRHFIVLVAVYFLTGMRLPPSLLLAAYLLADIVIAYRMRALLRLPWLRTIFTKPPSRALEMLRAGQVHLFTDKGIDMLLNIDLFVLGLFVDEWKLGIYAEAAILVRCCLVISVGIRPLLRRQYTLLVKEKRSSELVATLKRHGATLFSIQGILALLTLLYYPGIQSFFFRCPGGRG